MSKIFNLVLLAVIAAGSANMAFAEPGKTAAQPQCRVADLQRQVDRMSNEIAALQAQTQTPSSSENVIDNLATGG